MAISKEYKADLQGKHEHKSKWGTSAVRFAGPELLGLIERFTYINSVLDYGCGKGQLQEYIQSRAVRHVAWSNYDPGIKGIDTLPEGRFDLVITCDVLEHVEPHLLDETIQEIWFKTRYMMYNNIPCTPTNDVFLAGPYKGQNIHLTVEGPAWWRGKIEENIESERLWTASDWVHGHRSGEKRRCTLVYERIA